METLRYIHYLYKVYEMRSFSKAAEALYIAQPSLSAIVKKVENETGFAIFDRSRSPIGLTPEGEYYMEYVKKIMAVEQQLEEYIAEQSSGRRGSLTVGGSSYYCAYVLSGLIAGFEALYPDCHVVTFEANTVGLVEALNQNTVDLGVSVDKEELTGIISRVWRQEHLLFAVPSRFEVNGELKTFGLSREDITSGRFLSEDYPSVSIGRFEGLPFLSLRRGSDLYARSREIFGRAGCKPNVTMHLDSLLTCYYIAQEGRGCCFVRSDMLQYVPQTDRLCFYKVDDPLTIRDVYLYYRPDSPRMANLRRLLEYLNPKI